MCACSKLAPRVLLRRHDELAVARQELVTWRAGRLDMSRTRHRGSRSTRPAAPASWRPSRRRRSGRTAPATRPAPRRTRATHLARLNRSPACPRAPRPSAGARGAARVATPAWRPRPVAGNCAPNPRNRRPSVQQPPLGRYPRRRHGHPSGRRKRRHGADRRRRGPPLRRRVGTRGLAAAARRGRGPGSASTTGTAACAPGRDEPAPEEITTSGRCSWRSEGSCAWALSGGDGSQRVEFRTTMRSHAAGRTAHTTRAVRRGAWS
jgi:hypothetical protein